MEFGFKLGARGPKVGRTFGRATGGYPATEGASPPTCIFKFLKSAGGRATKGPAPPSITPEGSPLSPRELFRLKTLY